MYLVIMPLWSATAVPTHQYLQKNVSKKNSLPISSLFNKTRIPEWIMSSNPRTADKGGFCPCNTNMLFLQAGLSVIC